MEDWVLLCCAISRYFGVLCCVDVCVRVWLIMMSFR